MCQLWIERRKASAQGIGSEGLTQFLGDSQDTVTLVGKN